MSEARVEVFLYGLLMDGEALRAREVHPLRLRRASVADFALRIGERATLIADPGAHVYGLLADLSRRELESLYRGAGLEDYRPLAVLAKPLDGGDRVAALCYTLEAAPPRASPSEPYLAELRRLLRRLDFPASYIAGLR